MTTRSRKAWRIPVLLSWFLACWIVASGAVAHEKGGMPDLSQDDQTCLPTSTANLIIWFGKHGYPKLILSGATEEDKVAHTLHAIMTATQARYDLGTRMDAVAGGIEKFIRNAGYSCDVEYRGLDWGRSDESGTKAPTAFSQEWLQENDDPNKGFILLLAYCSYDRDKDIYRDALNVGHAVTLVNAEPNLMLIHDPAHDNDETGRKIVTPVVLTGGTFELPGYSAPVTGLMLLSGSLLEAPPDAGVMVTGAVCITMHPNDRQVAVVSGAPSASNATVAGKGGVTGAPSSPPVPAASHPHSSGGSWAMWLFNLLFSK